ncbi:MAG TPA: GatB/YqeY domain-containing protein [Actinomycetota bacterium]|nr:GatB/YqeY domain-containing protein [Actinomycetota bacterium]
MTDPTLKAEIHEQMTAAMRSRDELRLSTLRMLISAIRYKEDELGHELSDDEVREVAGSQVKKRTESIEVFEQAGRSELVAKEVAEREVLAEYAPEQLSDEAVDALVDEAIASTGATSVQQMGQVMGTIMGKAKGQVDGSVVQAKVKAKLGG